MSRVIVIGAGVSGMSVGYRLMRDHRVDVTVLEAEHRPGGKAQTLTMGGFRCEEATNGWLDKEPAMRDLLRDLSLENRVQPSMEAAERRFIYRDGKLRELHMHPLKFMTSSSLPLASRLRLAWEPFIPPRDGDDDETLARFARRRLGRGASDLLIGPMASGVYAGDPERMSLVSCFPKVHALEKTYGGLIRGMIALKKARRAAGMDPSEVKAGPSGRLMSLKGGMTDLCGALADALGDALRLDAAVTAVRRTASGLFEVEVDGAGILRAEAVISAAPAWAAAGYLKPLDADAAAAFGEIPYPCVTVVCLGFRREHVRHHLDGFGFLVPRGQGKSLLGALFTSSIFPFRAPEGHLLIRSMAGGMLEPQVATWGERETAESVTEELADILGLETERPPMLVEVFKHDRAIPQYHVGHGALVQRIAAAEARQPGFFATGNALRGIGVVDCVRESAPTAAKVAQFLNQGLSAAADIRSSRRPVPGCST